MKSLSGSERTNPIKANFTSTQMRRKAVRCQTSAIDFLSSVHERDEKYRSPCLPDIPGEVVLLFEANGHWNLAAATELLKQRNDLDVYVFLVNGENYRYNFTVGGFKKYDRQSKKGLVDALRWKP